ncbi:MAG: flagellar basal-body rod protein FlgG [Candidatus Brocadiia bacterium]
MMKALFTAATGMKCQQSYIDVVANNLANVNTTGFKGSELNFQDMLYEHTILPGTEATQNNEVPTGLDVGSGARIVSSTRDFAQGSLNQTTGNLDMAIQGLGFFRVTMPDGTLAYTRDGSFGLDGNGRLVTASGLPIADNISIPSNATSITVSSAGQVYINTPGSTQQTLAGTLTLAGFANPPGLNSLGGNLYAQTVASGTATIGNPGLNGVGTIQQGYLEGSNVDVVTELVRLITAQRAYEINSKAITTADKMLQESNALVQ